ncbi:MAG: hypothetical protein V3W44_02845, partial [Dehalococcoidales bacterium]
MRSTIPPAANQPLGTAGDPPTIKKNAEKRKLLLRLSISVLIFSWLFFGWQPAPASAAITRVQSKIVSEDPNNPPGPDINTISLTLDSAITEGNLIYTTVAIDKNSGTITPPSGYTLIHDYVSSMVSLASAFKVAGPSESTTITWNWVTTVSRGAQAAAVEYSGLATSSPLDVKAEADSGASTSQTQTTGTTATTTQADALAIAKMGSDSSDNVAATRSWTNSFTEFLWAGITNGNPGLSVADKILSATGTQESTFSTTSVGDELGANIAVFKAAAATYTTPGTFTYTVPSGCDSVFIQTYGAGGGGTGTDAGGGGGAGSGVTRDLDSVDLIAAGGGGAGGDGSAIAGAGGGGYATADFAVSAGETYTVTVGGGGSNGGTDIGGAGGGPGAGAGGCDLCTGGTATGAFGGGGGGGDQSSGGNALAYGGGGGVGGATSGRTGGSANYGGAGGAPSPATCSGSTHGGGCGASGEGGGGGYFIHASGTSASGSLGSAGSGTSGGTAANAGPGNGGNTGANGGNGKVVITPSCSAPAALTAVVSNVSPGWANSRKRAVFYNGDRFFLLYSKVDTNLYYQSSTDNVTWSGESTLITDNSGSKFDIYLVSDTKFDLTYAGPSTSVRAKTCTISGATITCGAVSILVTALSHSELVVGRTGVGDRIYVAARFNAYLRVWSADQTGDAQNVTSWTKEIDTDEGISNLAMAPYQASDKILVAYTRDAGGATNDGVYSRVMTAGGGVGTRIQSGNFDNLPDISNIVRISDTDFRIIIRPPSASMEEWTWNDTSWSQVEIVDAAETDQDSPSLFYDRINGDLYAFSIDTGATPDQVERHKKPSGGSWGTEVAADADPEAGDTSLPITQMHESPYGSTRTDP